LIEFSRDDEPVGVAVALRRLSELDPALVLTLAESAITNPNAHVRERAVSAYLVLLMIGRVRSLSHLLNDPHPDVRKQVCNGLLAPTEQSELIGPIRAAATEILAGDQWQGQEQAALLLSALAHQSELNRLVELLESPRGEVMTASAWARRKLAMLESIPALIDKVRRQTDQWRRQTSPAIDAQVAHLFVACGLVMAADVAPLMFDDTPKRQLLGEQSRSAAIWTLGRLFEGRPNDKLGVALEERVTDIDVKAPESQRVKYTSAVALARMKCVNQARRPQAYWGDRTPPSRFGLAMRMGHQRINRRKISEGDSFERGSGYLVS
jgi:hypothetical protein